MFSKSNIVKNKNLLADLAAICFDEAFGVVVDIEDIFTLT